MTIAAKILAASAHPHGGPPLYSLQLRYPKLIHGELMTHRVFSRNASSSRAIPVERMIQDVLDDPVIPMHWGKNQPGMQAREECDEPVLMPMSDRDDRTHMVCDRLHAWLRARDQMVDAAGAFAKAKYHKQIVNRLLEPWLHINVVVTATEWSNFFALRCHPDAQPEMRALAEAVRDAIAGATPRVLQPGEWHLPYVTPRQHESGADEVPMNLEQAINVSVARCARVSYLTHDGKVPAIEQDLALYDRLAASVPLHASPCEHQATPDEWDDSISGGDLGHDIDKWLNPQLHGNLRGWIQYRKTLPGECQ